MKRFIASMLAAVLLAASMPVMAQNGINKADYEAYIDKVRVCFDLPEDLPNVNIDQYDKNIGFSWRSEDGTRTYNAEIDEDGYIRSFYSYRSDLKDSKEKLTKEQSIAKAESVMKAVYGDKAADFERVNLNIDAESVYLTYRYTQNGIPVDATVNIGVRRKDGGISNFYGVMGKVLEYNYVKPESVKLLTEDEVYQNYKDSENIGLYYNVFNTYNEITGMNDQFVKPVYIVKPKNINASTGETIVSASVDDYVTDEEASMELDAGSGASNSKRVTEAERKAIKEFENLISQENADKAVKAAFPQIKSYTLESSNITTYGDRPRINLSYKNADRSNYASAVLNAQSGEILSFGNYIYNDKELEKTFDKKKTEAAAEELFKSIAKDIYDSKDYKKSVSENNDTISYDRLHDGIKVLGQGVTVSFNYDMTVRAYSRDWDKFDFPSAKNAVNEREIFEKSKAEGFGLKYVITDNAAVLAYGYTTGSGRYFSYWSNDSYYDALTGDKISAYDGTVHMENPDGNYTDLDGSPYKQVIETLAEYGYTLPYSEFKPNEYITIEDFYNFVGTDIIYIDSKRSYYGSEPLYSEEEVKNILTKYDIAKITVTQSGYGELASKDIFKTEFTDVNSDNAGYVAIASAMGYIPEKGGEFNGTKQITRGEAAEYIYKSLEAADAL